MIIYRKGIGSLNTELSEVLGPYSNRGERIGARISLCTEREREIIKYTCVIKERKKSPATNLGLFLAI